MKETPLLAAIRIELGKRPAVRVFRNNNGVLQDRHGNYVTYGLGPGTSDLIGWTIVMVTPQMIGRRLAVFTALEVKRPKGGRRTLEQKSFISTVLKHGGLAGFARSIDEAYAILGADLSRRDDEEN